VIAYNDDLIKKGWTRLPFQFSEEALGRLTSLNIHEGRGQRLSDMTRLHEALPQAFKNELRKLDFSPVPNRAVGFVKSKGKNWSLPWHQDRVIAMPRKVNGSAYENWSRKSGVWHCEPKTEMLQNMAFAYIAFDQLDEMSGGLQIAEGTHHCGKVAKQSINSSVSSAKCVLPRMERGDVLLVTALTIHRSALTQGARLRRTLRMDFIKIGTRFPS